jgi:MFS family permease
MNGMTLTLLMIDQSEIARPCNRGRLITLYQVGATLGMSISYWISYGTYLHQPTHISWMLPIAFQLVPGGLLLLGLHLIPESPRWLIYRNRHDEAFTIMAMLRSQGNQDDLNLQMEFTGVRQDVWFDKRYTRKSFLALWSTGTENNLTRTLLGMGIHIFTQLSGINAIL